MTIDLRATNLRLKNLGINSVLLIGDKVLFRGHEYTIENFVTVNDVEVVLFEEEQHTTEAATIEYVKFLRRKDYE